MSESLPKLYTARQAAEMLGLSYSTLQRLKAKGQGPAFIRLTPNGSIRYLETDLYLWLSQKANHKEV